MAAPTTTAPGTQVPLFEGNVGDCSGCTQGANRGFVIFGRQGSMITVAISLQSAIANTEYIVNWKCVTASIGKFITSASGSAAFIITFDGGTNTHFAIDMQGYNTNTNQMIDKIGSGGVDLH